MLLSVLELLFFMVVLFLPELFFFIEEVVLWVEEPALPLAA